MQAQAERKSDNQRQQEPEQKAKAPDTQKQESVTFLWNRAVGTRTLTLRPAKTLHTPDGAIIDPDNPAIRITAKNGIYITNDPEIIKLMKASPEFETKTHDGFFIQRAVKPEDQIRAIAKQAGLTPEQLRAALTKDTEE